MNINVMKKNILDEFDIAEYVSDMADRIKELEEENDSLKERLFELSEGVA